MAQDGTNMQQMNRNKHTIVTCDKGLKEKEEGLNVTLDEMVALCCPR
jgi:hypothetical protein